MRRTVHAVFPKELVQELLQRAEAVMAEIRADYFPGSDLHAFRSGHLGHTSLIMKMAAFRFASGDVLNRLKRVIAENAGMEGLSGDALLLHPIFYLRFSWPDVSYSSAHKSAFLDSQPHYDRAFGLPAHSFWMPLEPASGATGGICYFEDERALKAFEYGPSNKHNYDTYLEAAAALDPLLRETVQAPVLNVGDVFTFDRTVLHGATKPKSARRVSFDFRLCRASAVAQSAPWVQDLVAEFNRAPDLCNARNLLTIGDFLGASRVLSRVAEVTDNRDLGLLADSLSQLAPGPDLLRQHAVMAWQSEYSWARPAAAS